MRILFLAPQPFFQERGTPIAVRLAVEVLAGRRGDRVDLLTYHEGQDVEIPGMTLRRIKMPSWIKGIGPGISVKKLLCDVVFCITAFLMARRSKADRYDLVHAVEESVFVAWVISKCYRIPYIYDMDSSLALQLTEKWWVLRPLFPLLEWIERRAVRDSIAVVPVCDALAAVAARHGSSDTQVLSDISFLRHDVTGREMVPSKSKVSLRTEIEGDESTFIFLYIGNLERYQGIDLLVESFRLAAERLPQIRLAIIGGNDAHIAQYQRMVDALGLTARVRLLGPRPISLLNEYLTQADALVSPRTLGNNTPMKIYSYLHSGVPVVATRLPTHTQVLDDKIAKLSEPNREDFGRAMQELASDPAQASSIGDAARALAEERYTFERFHETLNAIYDRMSNSVQHKRAGNE